MAVRKKPKQATQPRVRRSSVGREKPQKPGLERLLREVQEQQAATAAILKVIASSPGDVQPVFDAIVRSARKLLGAPSALVTRRFENELHVAAMTSISKSRDKTFRSYFPAPLNRRGILADAILKKRAVFVSDSERQGTPTLREIARTRGYRSSLAVPLIRDGIAIGTVSVTRVEPGPFSAHQIALLEGFADQAVIAIENARRFNETREALDRQTATAEILKVIASSPSDVQPVFEAIVASAKRLIGGFSALVTRVVGDMQYLAAFTTTGDAGDA